MRTRGEEQTRAALGRATAFGRFAHGDLASIADTLQATMPPTSVADAQPLTLEGLPKTQVGQDGDRIVAVLYTVVAADSEGSKWLEFCFILTGPPVHDEVLFGVGHGTGEWWDNRWDRGRAATEYVYFDAVGRWPTN